MLFLRLINVKIISTSENEFARFLMCNNYSNWSKVIFWQRSVEQRTVEPTLVTNGLRSQSRCGRALQYSENRALMRNKIMGCYGFVFRNASCKVHGRRHATPLAECYCLGNVATCVIPVGGEFPLLRGRESGADGSRRGRFDMITRGRVIARRRMVKSRRRAGTHRSRTKRAYISHVSSPQPMAAPRSQYTKLQTAFCVCSYRRA